MPCPLPPLFPPPLQTYSGSAHVRSQNGQAGGTASLCQILSKSLRDMAIFRFLKMADVAMLKWAGNKGQKPQNLQKWVLGAVRGHSRSLAMSPLLDHTWFLVVISSNDRAILYRYRNIARYYVKNRKNFPTPRINYRVDLRHYLTDPTKFGERLIITDEHYCFWFSIFLPHYEWRRIICCD